MGIQISQQHGISNRSETGAGRGSERSRKCTPEQQGVGRQRREARIATTRCRKGWMESVAGRVHGAAVIGDHWYHPGNWRKRLDFGTGTFGDMGCQHLRSVFKALALTGPLSVRSEAPPRTSFVGDGRHLHYVFPRHRFLRGQDGAGHMYDGKQRPPAEIMPSPSARAPTQMTRRTSARQGSISSDRWRDGASSCRMPRLVGNDHKVVAVGVTTTGSQFVRGVRDGAKRAPTSTTPARSRKP